MCKSLKERLLGKLRELRLDNDLYVASTGSHYQKIWVRDSFYEVLSELHENPESYKKTIHRLLDYYINIENKYNKFSNLINNKTFHHDWEYPHPRCTYDLDEINEKWQYMQFDCYGEILYAVWLGEKNGLNIIRDDKDRKIINLVIKMLEAIDYTKVQEGAMWEEKLGIHTSSIGACLSGLTAIKTLGFEVSIKMLNDAHEVLNKLLPRESHSKEVDLAQMTLIYPYNIVPPEIARQILINVERYLLKERGCYRYITPKDIYYINKDNGQSAEWCFGISYLALSYHVLGEDKKAKHYLDIAKERTVVNGCEVPELYLGGTDEYNDNTALGWSNSMLILAIKEIEEGIDTL